MFLKDNYVHFFKPSLGLKTPQKFTYPFQYVPHKLCKKAVNELQNYLENQKDFKGNFSKLGKMFGVLIVKTLEGNIGYLAAFSGKIDEKVLIKGFVPPVFNSLNPDGFFKKGEEKINTVNKKIKIFKSSKKYASLKQKIERAKCEKDKRIAFLKQKKERAKKVRDTKRKNAKQNLKQNAIITIYKRLQQESISQNIELREVKKDWSLKIEQLEKELIRFEKTLNTLKDKRKVLSAKLQQQLHSSYSFFNANDEKKTLLDIFEELNSVPPAGTGECCAPKLLQFAYKNSLQPIAMAEFWWGKSPFSQIRVHKQYYPACKSKCKPVLSFMMQGLNVDENPVKNRDNVSLEILFEDQYLIILNKPYRFLSVPGKSIKDSVLTRMKQYLPNATGPLLVHRLDMSTSGLLLVAKSSKVHKNLQQQFASRVVKKRYVAIIKGVLQQKNGLINLPLQKDYHNRPKQLVCYKNGKQAITRYKVKEVKGGKTRLHLYPETGRTHQLRVHCAHHLGLNSPILGDDLYGTPENRLYLHAEELTFIHPTTKKIINSFKKANF